MAKSRSEPELLVWNYPNGLVPLKDVKVKEPTMTDDDLIEWLRGLAGTNGLGDVAADRLRQLSRQATTLSKCWHQAAEERDEAENEIEYLDQRLIDAINRESQAIARYNTSVQRLQSALRTVHGHIYDRQLILALNTIRTALEETDQ